MFRLFSSLVVAAAVALATPAAASPPSTGPDDESIHAYRDAVDRGVTLFAGGKYEAARDAFEDAYELHPAPVLIFNIASTYRRENDVERALAYYRRFLAEADETDPRVALARETIAHLETIQRERAELEERAERAADEPAAGDEPSAEREPPAEDEPLPALSPRAVSDPAGARDRPGLGRRRVGLALLGVGGTSLAVAGIEALRAHRAAADLRSLPEGTPWDPEHEQRYDDGEAARNRAIGLSLVGAAVTVTGALLYRRGRKDARAHSVAITPTAGPQFVGVVGRIDY